MNTYKDFGENVLPRIKKLGYNAIQVVKTSKRQTLKRKVGIFTAPKKFKLPAVIIHRTFIKNNFYLLSFEV